MKSDLLPPPQMEESELHEVLQHTMANVNGKAYRTMVNQLFSQITSPVMDYTYDINLHKVPGLPTDAVEQTLKPGLARLPHKRNPKPIRHEHLGITLLSTTS